MRRCVFLIGFYLVFANFPSAANAGGTLAHYKRADSFARKHNGLVLKKKIEPNWFAHESKFWYRNDLRKTREFVLVDAEAGTRLPAFNHQGLAEAINTVLGTNYPADELPFETVKFTDDCNSVEFEIDEAQYRCDLISYECVKLKRDDNRKNEDSDGDRNQSRRRRGRGRRDDRSPDGTWEAFVRDHNLYIRSTGDAREFRLSHDGEPNNYYSHSRWSPDSQKVVAFRTIPGDGKVVYLIESSPKGGGRAKLHSHQYDLPGDKLTSYTLSLFDIQTKERIDVDAEPVDFEGPPRLRWAENGDYFTYKKSDRGHQRVRVFRVDADNGKIRTIIDEKSETFINEWWDGGVNPRYLDESGEIIWPSERHGYRHLYLYDAESGKLKNRITKGNWVVRGIVNIDERQRTIEFTASGRNEQMDPYLIQYYRINFDGSGLVCLTPGNGNHKVQFSPDRRYIIDTYSRVDMPPVHELRSSKDGSLICKLEQADASALLATDWKMPAPFVVQGRDGKTDIYGLIFRPTTFDQTKKYPVVEKIYAGPHGSFVPKSWSDVYGAQSMAELGFIVVQIDGMGTNNRSKAFHDVCWKNLADSGFPDRILWIKAAAEEYPYMDITRVGVYGTSAGGQSAASAVFNYGDFYDVAVSSCGCHDNRMDKASWNEQWMGYPVGPHYAEQSNITNAHKLTGDLLLMVGELDRNVPPESTYRLVDALIRAEKEFELVVLPGKGHTSGGEYGMRKRRDFFVEHLLDVAPPDWNLVRQ